MELGKRIASARAEANMTQQQLADKLFVSRELISKWEQGLRRPDHAAVVRIAQALGVGENKLITREECALRELRRCLPKGENIPREALSAMISRFLRGLPQKEADIFIRRYHFLNSNAEIALLYGMGENQVRSRLSKTAKKLEKYLKEEWSNERH